MASKGKILLVDDDPAIRKFYAASFAQGGYHTEQCANLKGLREHLHRQSFGAILLDLKLKCEDGLEGLNYIAQVAPMTQVFVLTSQSNVQKAVEAMNQGATWYFTKDTPVEKIQAKIEDSLSHNGETAPTPHSLVAHNLIGQSKAMEELSNYIEKLKNVDSTVLILGESGAGKEVVARAIHNSSARSAHRFGALNCGAIPQNLLESELFGHKKGAFTDATSDRTGIFESCHSGTLLLDEIGDMDLGLQAKLLRVLQEKQVIPIGSNQVVKVNARVIAATHRDLWDEINCGRFRQDLYYRLSVLVIEIPPLRHRKEDIPLLVNHFLAIYNRRFHKEVSPPAPSTLKRLVNYDWPGNIRELQNAVERGVVLAHGSQLTSENMFSHLQRGPSLNPHSALLDEEILDLPLSEAKQVFEKIYLEHHLKQNNGNIAQLSRHSGKYRADLYRLLERYHIPLTAFRSH